MELARRHTETTSAAYRAGEVYGEALNLRDRFETERAERLAAEALRASVGLPDWAKARMDARLAILDALAAFERAAGCTRAKALKRFCRAYRERALGLDGWVHDEVEKVSARTLFHWQALIEGEGPLALAGKFGKRADRDYRCVIDEHAGMHEAAMGLIAKHGSKVSAPQVHALLEARFHAEAPSKRTVQRWLKNWREGHRQLASYLDSPDQWRNTHKVAFGRADDEVVRVNQVWELDSTLADLTLAERQPDGTIEKRRWALVACIDVYTRRGMLVVTRTSRSTAIAAVLRRCILEWGVPELVRLDNGKDYTSRHIERALGMLKVDRHLCRPFHPEEKPFVERFYKTLQHGLMELLPGFVGHDVAQRQRIRSRKGTGQKARTLGEVEMAPVALQAFLDEWCHSIYERNEHSGLSRTVGRAMTPFARYTSFDGVVKRVPDEHALDLLMAPAPGQDGWRTVRKKGVAVGDRFFVAPELAAHTGERVLVLCDPWRTDQVCVYGGEGLHFLCWARIPQSAEERQKMAVNASRYQRDFLSAQKKELQAAAKRGGTENAWQEIIAARSEEAAKTLAMPKQSEIYETAALAEAKRAADARAELDANPPPPAAPSPQQKARIHQLKKDDDRRQRIEAGLERPRFWDDEWHRYTWLRDAIQRGQEGITDEDRAYVANYRKNVLNLEN